jgi:hypothetical protein
MGTQTKESNMESKEITEAFEAWYLEEYVIRSGARGRASRNLTKHEGEYISDHAAECFKVWCAAIKRMIK